MQADTSPKTFWSLINSRLFLSLGVVVVAAVILITGFFFNRNEIRIVADGKETKIVMHGGTVDEALKKAGITIAEKDIVQPPLNQEIKEDQKIQITRVAHVNLVADGKTVDQWVPVGTVEQTLKILNVALIKGDEVVPPLKNIVTSETTIEIIRFKENYIKQNIKVPYRVERRKDNTMEVGLSQVAKRGQDGLLQKTVKITLKNGKEVKREVVGENVIQEPITQVVLVGNLSSRVVSRGDNIKFSKVLTMRASAYSHTGHNTASGVYPRKGAIAVDPSVIPLGTRMYIEGYGYAQALDVGSAIQGNRIDLFFESDRQAHQFGRRSVKVYFLK